MGRTFALALFSLALSAGSGGCSEEKTAEMKKTDASQTAAQGQAQAEKPAAGSAAQTAAGEGAAPATTGAAMNEIVVMETNMGTIKLKMFSDVAPKAVENFVGLAKKGYYDGVTFHRVIDTFMIQGGDPSGNGTGGQSIWGAPFADEYSPKYRFDRKGLLAMANRGPATNGSQFFITLAPTPHLNDRHTIFGEVVEGMDVVEKIGKVKVSAPANKPLEPVKMVKFAFEAPKAAGAE
jgi:peptidylprolyl isomerase